MSTLFGVPSRLLVAFLAFSVAAACDEMPVLGTEAGEPVTLVVPIDGQQFAADAVLTATVWDARQLEALEQNALCAVTRNPQTQAEEIHCPDGVQYQEVTPEEFSFPVSQAAPRLEIQSSSIQTGQRFRLRVTGLYRDNCNMTSADFRGTAQEGEMLLADLEWQTTLKGCP